MQSHINVGISNDITITELTKAIANAVDSNGEIDSDATKPDGMLRKPMDSSRLAQLGW